MPRCAGGHSRAGGRTLDEDLHLGLTCESAGVEQAGCGAVQAARRGARGSRLRGAGFDGDEATVDGRGGGRVGGQGKGSAVRLEGQLVSSRLAFFGVVRQNEGKGEVGAGSSRSSLRRNAARTCSRPSRLPLALLGSRVVCSSSRRPSPGRRTDSPARAELFLVEVDSLASSFVLDQQLLQRKHACCGRHTTRRGRLRSSTTGAQAGRPAHAGPARACVRSRRKRFATRDALAFHTC